MKIESDYLIGDIDTLWDSINIKTKSNSRTIKDIEIYLNGEITIQNDDEFICMDVKELEEIVRVYKIFRDRKAVIKP